MYPKRYKSEGDMSGEYGGYSNFSNLPFHVMNYVVSLDVSALALSKCNRTDGKSD